MRITDIPTDLYGIDYDQALHEGNVIIKRRHAAKESVSPIEIANLDAEAVVEPFDVDPMAQWDESLNDDGNPVFSSDDSFVDELQIPDYLLATTESRTDKALRLRTQSFIKPGEEITPAKGVALHIGIDSEYMYNPKTVRIDILSYQFFVITPHGEYADIIYPKSRRVSDRLGFEELLSHIIIMSREKKLIDEWPKVVYVYAHFLRADLASFGDFWQFKTKIDGIRTTVASVNSIYGVDLESLLHRKARPSPLILKDKQRKAKRVLVTFVDTMLHTPGQEGLAAVGELIGLPKLSIPDGYSIERMDELLAGDKAAFEAYALRDAEIAVKYGLRLHEFTRNLGLSSLPKSIGGCATSLFLKHLRENGHDRDQMFGTYEVEKIHWPEKSSRPVTKWVREANPAAKLFESFAISCYHGGRNECFLFGPTSISTFNDFDLSGAYTTGLVDLFALNYAEARMTCDPADFVGHVFGLARVSFKFPAHTRYPSLPVRTDYGLMFPLSGESYCTAPEIEVALRMGCQIEILQGVIIPWADTQTRIFEPFVALVREMRKSYPKKSFEERLWKELGNSLYGKLAQGLRGKTAFDTTSGLNKPIAPSAITNPYFAAHVTGLIRALLGEQLASIPQHRTVVSVTTDGYLTDATRDELNLSGPMSQRFQALGELLDGESFNMLEQKHKVQQIIAIRTRGQLTPEGIEGEPEILAKCGVKPPCEKEHHQDYMLSLYLERYPGQKVNDRQLISTSDMWINERDLVSITREKRLNLEFDFKRQPMMPSMQSVLGGGAYLF